MKIVSKRERPNFRPHWSLRLRQRLGWMIFLYTIIYIKSKNKLRTTPKNNTAHYGANEVSSTSFFLRSLGSVLSIGLKSGRLGQPFVTLTVEWEWGNCDCLHAQSNFCPFGSISCTWARAIWSDGSNVSLQAWTMSVRCGDKIQSEHVHAPDEGVCDQANLFGKCCYGVGFLCSLGLLGSGTLLLSVCLSVCMFVCVCVSACLCVW